MSLNIDYFFINDKQVTGDGNWSNGTKTLEPTVGETNDDFIHRALEQMNAPGASMIGFVLRYTDATKTTIQSARAKNATVNANANSHAHANAHTPTQAPRHAHAHAPTFTCTRAHLTNG